MTSDPPDRLMSTRSASSSLAGLCLTSLCAAQSELPAAADVLARLDAHTAVPEARARARNLRVRGTITAAGMAEAGTYEELYAADGRVLYRVAWRMPGSAGGENAPPETTTTQGTDGKVAWTTDPALGVAVFEGEERALALRMYATMRRAPWQDLYVAAAVTGTKQLDGHEHFELRLTTAAGESDTWFVHAQAHTLSRVDSTLPDPNGGKLSVRWLFSDYRRVDGVLYPWHKRQLVGAYVIEYAVTDLEHPAALDAARLAPPAEVAAAIADPARRSPRAPAAAAGCEVREVDGRHAASIRVEVAEADISKTLAVLLPEVMQYLGSIGEVPAGPPFTRYHAFAGEKVDLEAGIPVRKAVAGEGRVRPAELPGGRAAVVWHIGDYRDLAATHRALETWMQAQKLEPRSPRWEMYWTDPGIEPDTKKWRTQIVWPVK
jgi:effector-binding domain-containing protein